MWSKNSHWVCRTVRLGSGQSRNDERPGSEACQDDMVWFVWTRGVWKTKSCGQVMKRHVLYIPYHRYLVKILHSWFFHLSAMWTSFSQTMVQWCCHWRVNLNHNAWSCNFDLAGLALVNVREWPLTTGQVTCVVFSLICFPNLQFSSNVFRYSLWNL